MRNYVSACGNIVAFPTESIIVSNKKKILQPMQKLLLQQITRVSTNKKISFYYLKTRFF